MTQSVRQSKSAGHFRFALGVALLCCLLGLSTSACKGSSQRANLDELEAFLEQLEQQDEDVSRWLDRLEAYLEESEPRRRVVRELLDKKKAKNYIDERGPLRDRYVSLLHRLAVAAAALHREARAEGPLTEQRARSLLSRFSLSSLESS